jgi:hypothetical protein
MVSYKVNVPESKQSFFQEFLDLIGAEYEKNQNADFELSDAQKETLDQRLKSEKNEFVSARESLEKLRKTYGL